MLIIFCDSGFSAKEVDYFYAEEYQVAKVQGYQTALISFEALQKNQLKTALKRIKPPTTLTTAIYRGWMLKPRPYRVFYAALLEKNIRLINTPEQYQFCHYLPESYSTIQDYTPLTTFKKLESPFKIANFRQQISIFGNRPIIVKDFVKSQKHYWAEACFIPAADDEVQVTRVVEKFLELQGDDLNEGLVFREFVELEALTKHSQSGMPLTKEFRVFIKNGRIVQVFPYWDEGDYADVTPVLDHFQTVIPNIQSNFFTMDIAQQKNGDWIIVELGDGQVAGLPDNADRTLFYQSLSSE